MEPRGVMAEWDAAKGRLTISGAAKVPFFNRRILAKQIELPESQIEMIENDVGGGYGARGEFYPEDFLIPFAARHVNRPVKWIEDRRENLMAMNHARESEAHHRDRLRARRHHHRAARRGPHRHGRLYAHQRRGRRAQRRAVHGRAVSRPAREARLASLDDATRRRSAPIAGRAASRSSFFIERLLDMVAGDLGIDRVELRRRNLITAAEQPYPIASVQPTDANDQYDSGEYREALDRALKEFNWAEKAKLQGKLIDGKYHGLGIGCFVEGGAAGPKESARLDVNEDGTITVFMGSSAVGQGVETVFAQIAADALEIPMDRIRHVYHGSTSTVSDGYGAYHSRSIVMGGSALLDATEKFQAAIREAGAKKLGCAPSEIKIGEDRVSGGGKSFPLAELSGLTAEGAFLNKKHTYSYGTHAAHVTVDAKTGEVRIVDYVVVQDVGRAINPLTLRGQIIGSLVQGLGGAMLEHLQYDEQGQFLTGSLADYLLPTATDFPNLRCFVTDDHPSPINPLGAKGAGEGGIVAAGGVMANAVANALSSFGVQPRRLPLTPSYIWELVQAGSRQAAE